MASSRFKVERGSYHGTTDDRADRWYVTDTESNVIDRRGSGYRTKQEAQERVRELELFLSQKWEDPSDKYE